MVQLLTPPHARPSVQRLVRGFPTSTGACLDSPGQLQIEKVTSPCRTRGIRSRVIHSYLERIGRSKASYLAESGGKEFRKSLNLSSSRFGAGAGTLRSRTQSNRRFAGMGAEGLDTSYLGITAIITVIFQSFFFLIAARFKIDKVTDFAGTTNFVVLAVLTFILNGTHHLRQIVLTTFVILWGLRLGIFLLLRILSWGEDKRFDDKRDNLMRFAVFWILQGVWVWTVSLPVTVLNGTSNNPYFSLRDYVGWAMWAVGMVVEAVADQSKLNFKNSPENKGRWCDAGLWSWSRHPNYFGEMLLWWGIFVSTTPVLSGGQWAVITSPILLCFLLLFLSGIPLLESSADKRHRTSPEYLHYKKTTSPLIPLPPAVYGSLPSWFKKIFLFEFPMYSKRLRAGSQVKSS